jgi:predicted esterase
MRMEAKCRVAPLEPLTFADLARLAQLEDRGAAAAELRAAFEQDRIWRISLFSIPELRAFVGDPAVAPIVTAARSRVAALDLQPELLVADPGLPGARPLLVVLHGARHTAGLTLARWAAAADAGYIVAAGQSSQPSAPDGFCWDPPEERVDADLEAIAAQLPPGHARIVLAGYSQGAWVALRTALRGTPFTASRVVMVSPFVGSLEHLPPSARRLRIAILAGARDPYSEGIQRLANRLRERGHHLRIELIEGLGHEYPDDFAARLPGLLEAPV